MSNLGDQLNNLSFEKQLYILPMLPTHIADAGQMERLRHVQTNFEFMEAKVSVLGPQTLINDYNLIPDNNLRLIQHALRREVHVLSQRPELLWQQLYNRLQWEGDVDRDELERECERRSASGRLPWFRLRNRASESEALQFTLAGHEAGVTACAFSPDGLSSTLYISNSLTNGPRQALKSRAGK